MVPIRPARVAGLPCGEKAQGLPSAPRPIITASQPVSACMRRASAWFWTSPLPITGMRTACFTAATMFQSAWPPNPWAQVRPWTTTAAAPASSAMTANCGAVRLAASQPLRNLTVTGRRVCAHTARMIAAARSGSFIRATPAPFFTTLRTGQPMFRSIRSTGRVSTRAAARPMASGSAPNSCRPKGRSASTVRISSKVFRWPKTRPWQLTISETHSAAPCSRQSRRKGRSE